MLRSSILRQTVPATGSQSGSNTRSNSPIGGMTLIVQAIVEILSDAFDYEEGLKDLMKLAGFSGRNSNVNGRKSIAGAGSNNASSALTKPFPMVATCAFYLLPELRRMFQEYTEEIIQEVASQVQQDSWSSITTSCLEIVPSILDEVGNGGGTGKDSTTAAVTDVSSSYLWMITALNHVFSEIIIMLNKQTVVGAYASDARSTVLLSKMEVSEVRLFQSILIL